MEGRHLNRDLFSLGLLGLVILLAISLATYDPADSVQQATGWMGDWYQSDQLVYPVNQSIHNACGRLGAVVSDSLFSALGYGAFYLVGCLGILCYWLLSGYYQEYLFGRGLGWIISLVGITTLASLISPSISPGPLTGSGGFVGLMASTFLLQHFAIVGSLIVATGATLIGMMMWTDYALLRMATAVLGFSAAGFGATQVAAKRKIDDLIIARRARRETNQLGIEDPDLANSDAIGAHAAAEEASYSPAVIIGGKRREALPEMPQHEVDEDFYDNVDEDDDIDEYEKAFDEDEARNADHEETTLLVKMPHIDAQHVKNSQRDDENELDDQASEEEQNRAVKIAAKKIGGLSPDTLNAKKKLNKDQEREVAKSEIKRKIVDETDERLDDYELPSLDLLTSGDGVDYHEQEIEVRRKARQLEQTFKEFGFNIKVTEIETGPVIAQYELALETGLRLSKIVGLADDLAIALRVPSVRIVAPIPGKNTVGVEVPNEKRQVVRIRDVIEECSEKTKKMKIPIFLGKDVSGNAMTADLAALPHLLIAGRTGTGKSVCLNAIISSILMTRRPEEVRMLMIDPKMVELSGYSKLPHLMHPVVTDMKKAEAILAWAVDKMEERYSLLAQAGVRHLVNFNQLGAEEIYRRLGAETAEEKAQIPTNLPFIVIIADEMADLMMTAGKTVEQWIIRLAQKSRAVGIHLILATQKPTVDVITGLIKSNLPARIAFQVASKTDSRVVLDENGADKLLGNGDMLFLGPGTSILTRGQGTFLSDDEIDAIVESCAASGKQNFVTELVNLKVAEEKSSEGVAINNHGDDLYDSAVEAVIREQRGSVSMLQRIFKIGYGRAARLIDYMAEDGVVGPYNGKIREVVMTIEQWHAKTGEADDEPVPAPRKKGPIRLHDDEDDDASNLVADSDDSDDSQCMQSNRITVSSENRVAGVRKKVTPSIVHEEDDYEDQDLYDEEDDLGEEESEDDHVAEEDEVDALDSEDEDVQWEDVD